MANYPASLDSFSNPQGTTLVKIDDHAAQHRAEGSAIVALQQTVGTTQGTALFTTYGITDKPLAHRSGTLQNAVNGTLINTIDLTDGTIHNGQLDNNYITNPVFDGLSSGTLTGVTGTADGNNFTARGLKTATTTVNISGQAAPTDGQVLVATSSTTAEWRTPTPSIMYFGPGGGNLGVNQGNSGYFLALDTGNNSATEANTQTNSPAGVYGPLRINVRTNTLNGIGTIGLRINGSNIGPNIAIAAGSVGKFVGTALGTAVAGDLVNLVMITSAANSGAITWDTTLVGFTPS